MKYAVKSVKSADDYKLHVKFQSGVEKSFDLTPYLGLGRFTELRDVSLFKSVKVAFDSIAWANQLDMDPEFLYENGVVVRKTTSQRTGGSGKNRGAVARREFVGLYKNV